MTKLEFLQILEKKLSALPKSDVDERLSFYNEMIDDKIEEGDLEENSVSSLGEINDIVAQIISETPLVKLAKQKIKPKRKLSGLELTLIICGSPIWFTLLISLFAVVISLYATIWAVIVSLWSVVLALGLGGVGSIVLTIINLCLGNAMQSVMFLSLIFICLGLAIFGYFVCKFLTISTIKLTKNCILKLKNKLASKGVE